jgi:hypothetical protein
MARPPGHYDPLRETHERVEAERNAPDGAPQEAPKPDPSDDMEARIERALQEARAAAKDLAGRGEKPEMPEVDRDATRAGPADEHQPGRPVDRPDDGFQWTDSPRMDQQQRSALDWINYANEQRRAAADEEALRNLGVAPDAETERAPDDTRDRATQSAPEDERPRRAEDTARDAQRDGAPREMTDKERDFYDRHPGLTRDDGEAGRQPGQEHGRGGRTSGHE